MASNYLQIPASGSASWKNPVATVTDLPASGNTTGDARVAQDTQIIYIWSGSAWVAASGSSGVTSVGLALPASVFSVSGSPVTSSGTLTGAFTTQSANTAFMGPTSGAAATPAFRTFVFPDVPSPQVTKMLYVDKGRTDTYTADGTIFRPFKTIQAAVNQIITNADNTFSNVYEISIAAGTYNENVTLNSANLVNITLNGNGGAAIAPSSGAAISSTSSNNNLSGMSIYDIILTDVTFQGTFGGTLLNAGCVVYGSLISSLTLTNVGFFGTHSTQIQGNLTLNNAFAAIEQGSGVGGTGTTANALTNAAFLLLMGAPDISATISVDATSTYKLRNGAALGLLTSTISNAGGVYVESGSLIRGSYTATTGSQTFLNGGNAVGSVTINSGATLTINGGFVAGTRTYSGTIVNNNNLVNADIGAAAGIVDSKLATISTAGKVSNSATTATNANTASAIVARDASGNFSAGTITATVTGHSSLDLPLTGGTLTGALVENVAGAASTPGILVSGAPFTGGSATTTKPQLSVDSAATSNTWSTSGTALGVNAPSGFAGNLIDAKVNAVRSFVVTPLGIGLGAGITDETLVTNVNQLVVKGSSTNSSIALYNPISSTNTGMGINNTVTYFMLNGVAWCSMNNTNTQIAFGYNQTGTYYPLTHARSSSNTTPTSVVIASSSIVPPATVNQNNNTTVGNYGLFGNAGSDTNHVLNSWIAMFNDVHTNGSEESHMEFVTSSAGTRSVAMSILKTGQVTLPKAGTGLSIKTGSNCKMGTSVLVAGTVTVSTTAVTASSIIFLTHGVAGGTLGVPSVGTIVAGTSFVINSSSALDTSTINWLIIEPS